MFKKLALTVVLLTLAVQAQAQLVPYFGKNNVKYDTFDWKEYQTEHFEIFFYPEEEEHLQRIASMAESAYAKLSNQLQHDIEFDIPLIFFKTSSEFEQVNYLQISEGVLGAAEPQFNRMAFTIDQPPDKLYELIVHELTHVFEFSMLFGGIQTPIIRAYPPGWVMEGFAEFTTGRWDPADLMVVRDAVLTERMPYLSVSQGMIFPGGINLGRASYNVGHAAFDFIHSKYGEAAVRQFWFYLKKATLLGQEDVIYSSLGIKEETFNEQLGHYLRDRFSDFRDKQSPLDYGKEITLPHQYYQVFSQAPAPNGNRFAVMTANRDDFEFDILLIDAEGKVLRNLTGGSTTKYEYLTTDTYSFEGRNIGWSSDGSRLCFFARTGKRRSLFIVNAENGDNIKRIKMNVDQAGSPAISPNGQIVLFTGWLDGRPDMFALNVASEEVVKLTDDFFTERTPMWSSDGKWIFYTARVGEHDQIFRMNADDPKQAEQLTTSDYDSTSPYYDPATNSIFYSADRGDAYNLYKLDLNTGEKVQYTDVIGANFSPVLFRQNGHDRVAFTTFFKTEYRLFIMDLPEAIAAIPKGSEPVDEEGVKVMTAIAQARTTTQEPELAAQAVTPGPRLSDFQPTKSLEIDQNKIKDKKYRFLLAGRPNLITGVSGDSFAVATGVVLQDIMGDQEYRFFVSRVRGFQSYNVGYLDLRRRFQYLAEFIFNDDFFYAPLGPAANVFGFSTDIVRRRIWGGRAISQYPISRFYRFEFGAGVFDYDEQFYDPAVQSIYEQLLNEAGIDDPLSTGGYMPLSVALVGETTRFREFGPLSGYTFRLAYEYSPGFSDEWITRSIYEADLRKYFKVSSRSLVALRARGFYTTGDDRVIFSFGGGQDVRGFDFREIVGYKGGIGNVEYRFPMYPKPQTPFLGQLRGRVFLDYFRTDFLDNVAVYGYSVRPVNGQQFVLDFREGSGSFGVGFSMHAAGLPFNFDFSKVYGQGRFLQDGRLDLTQPTQLEITDGINFDFSIGFDF